MSKVNQVAKENKGNHDHFKVSDTNSGVFNADGKLNVVAGDVNVCPKCLEVYSYGKNHWCKDGTVTAPNNITMVQDWSPQGFSTEAYWRKRIAEEQKIDKIRELAQSLAKTDYRGNPPPEHYIAKKIFDILDGN
jgi:hypothetical protein